MLPLENKKRSKNKKTLKTHILKKNNKKRKKRFLHLCFNQHEMHSSKTVELLLITSTP